MEHNLKTLTDIMYNQIDLLKNPNLSEDDKERIKGDSATIALMAKNIISAANVATRAKNFASTGKINSEFVKEWIG